MIKTIPSLGNSATEILNKALNYPTAGYSLCFQTIFDGEYRVDLDGEINKIIWHGEIPLIGNSVKDDWMLKQIALGWVDIFVKSAGKNPHYVLELHRATGNQIKI